MPFAQVVRSASERAQEVSSTELPLESWWRQAMPPALLRRRGRRLSVLAGHLSGQLSGDDGDPTRCNRCRRPSRAAGRPPSVQRLLMIASHIPSAVPGAVPFTMDFGYGRKRGDGGC